MRSAAALAHRASLQPLTWVLLAGLLIRVVALATYSPSVLQWIDAIRFARVEPKGMFDDFWMPAGYPAFLGAARSVWNDLSFTIALQHCLGLCTAGLLYAGARRLGASRGAACVPAGVVALGGDYVFLEHIVMAEAVFLFVASGGLYLGTRGLTATSPGRERIWWLVVAAAVLTLAGLIRSPGLALPVALALAVLTERLPVRMALRYLAAIAVPAVAVVVCYVGFATSGPYSGLGDMSGWGLYARVAPTADCADFDVPIATRRLCERTPVADRWNSIAYVWEAGTPARRAYAFPTGNPQLEAFARAWIEAHPLTYAKVVAKDFARYIEPSVGRDRVGGITGDMMAFGWRDTAVEQNVQRWLGEKYTGLQVRAGGRELLDSYQKVTRLGSFDKLVLILLSIIGLWAARGELRTGVMLYGSAAFFLLLGPVAVLSYDIRYGVPPMALLSVSAVLGVTGLWRRRRTAATNP